MKGDTLVVKDVVSFVLTQDKRSRNDDKWLVLQVLREMGFKIFIDYKEIDTMPSFESITRCRRRFQEKGQYLAEPNIQIQRSEEEQEMKKINQWW